MQTEESNKADDWFYTIAFGEDAYYQHQGWLSGRTTTDDNFTNYKKTVLDENAPLVPAGDFIVPTDLKKYYISIDPTGRLAWESNTLHYQDTRAHVLEILTGKASNAYKAFLRAKNISYILAGNETLDAKQAMGKLKSLFGLELVMLGGGGVLNWSFIQQGLCDELSIILAPVADGAAQMPSLFETKAGLSEATPVAFHLEQVDTRPDGSVWLRYTVKK